MRCGLASLSSWLLSPPVLDDELSVQARVALIIVLLITPSILISFSGLIYAEANVILWLICLIWFLRRFEYTQSSSWAVAAVVWQSSGLLQRDRIPVALGFHDQSSLFTLPRRGRQSLDIKRIGTPESRLDLCLRSCFFPLFFTILR